MFSQKMIVSKFRMEWCIVWPYLEILIVSPLVGWYKIIPFVTTPSWENARDPWSLPKCFWFLICIPYCSTKNHLSSWRSYRTTGQVVDYRTGRGLQSKLYHWYAIWEILFLQLLLLKLRQKNFSDRVTKFMVCFGLYKYFLHI